MVLVGAVLAVLASALLTYAALGFARARGMLDVPNQRSSHTRPTPRGGGIAIVLTATIAFAILWASGMLEWRILIALLGGLPVAITGFLDDRFGLSARLRLGIHVVAALWSLAWLGGLPPFRVGGELYSLGPGGYVLGVLGIVWVLNLFNFMDGIDGIAASEATFVTWGGALLAAPACGVYGIATAAWLAGAASLGFLLWNWPPARIFMGDVGSGYVGYIIAVLALAAMRCDPTALPVWMILGGVFFVDATVTLIRRSTRGEPVYQAHRSHAYQALARRWAGHRHVTLLVIAVNVLWLLPWARFAALHPGTGGLAAVAALAPLVVLAVCAGAGRSEIV